MIDKHALKGADAVFHNRAGGPDVGDHGRRSIKDKYLTGSEKTTCVTTEKLQVHYRFITPVFRPIF
jgi:IS4 transposase